MKNLIYLLLLVVSLPTFAARQFDIEVILFKRNIAPEQINESWPDQQAAINTNGAIDFGDTARLKARGIRPMSPSRFRLNNQYNKLKNHAGFTTLAHFGWRQGDLSKAAAPRIHITAGKDFSAQFLTDGVPTTNAAPDTMPANDTATDGLVITTDNSAATSDLNAGFDSPATGGPLYELDGTIKVYVQHFLFTEANLELREPSRREIVVGATIDNGLDPLATEGNVQVGHLQEVKKQIDVEEFLKGFQFNQQRKMRSGETHYLDHPLMGMVIQIRKING